jgi:hypothetical protein
MNVTRRTQRKAATAVWLAAFVACATWATPTVDGQRRDRGVNQPGAVGNRGGVDPGINQPGAVGNRGVAPVARGGYGGSARQVRAAADPGFNQPGAIGNVGRDPGFNQPGAVGNVGRDPGVNQPGAVGNRR